MSKRDRTLVCALLLCGLFILSVAAGADKDEEAGNSCVQCHFRLPGNSFVGAESHSWTGSIHQKNGVTCDKCHGGNPQAAEEKEAHQGVLPSSNPKSTVYFKNVPATCGKCHGAQFYKFIQSVHYKMLESTGKGPECVTCHGSMVTKVVTPNNVVTLCEQCHNNRMRILPYIPQEAKAVLLLLRESKALLDADTKLYHPGEETAMARLMSHARTSWYSATLDWHTFELDRITGHLEQMYDSLEELSSEARKQ
jgi:formate-dependent nitrite reductase cytochrome c552 subunit